MQRIFKALHAILILVLTSLIPCSASVALICGFVEYASVFLLFPYQLNEGKHSNLIGSMIPCAWISSIPPILRVIAFSFQECVLIAPNSCFHGHTVHWSYTRT
eukprot:742917_1